MNYMRLNLMGREIEQEIKIEDLQMTENIMYGFVRRHTLCFRSMTHTALQDNRPIEERITWIENVGRPKSR